MINTYLNEYKATLKRKEALLKPLLKALEDKTTGELISIRVLDTEINQLKNFIEALEHIKSISIKGEK